MACEVVVVGLLIVSEWFLICVFTALTTPGEVRKRSPLAGDMLPSISDKAKIDESKRVILDDIQYLLSREDDDRWDWLGASWEMRLDAVVGL